VGSRPVPGTGGDAICHDYRGNRKREGITLKLIQEALHYFVEGGILLFEWIGVVVLLVAGIMGVINYVRRDPTTRLKLAQGLAMGLEFKLGGEILRTVLVLDMREIAVVGAIILLRAALTFLIHWEIKNEEESVRALSHPRDPKVHK